MQNPEIEAVDILLQERMPAKAVITKEKKEQVELPQIKDTESYSEKIYTKMERGLTKTNVISNGNYTVLTTWDGEGYSKRDNIYVSRFKETTDYNQGIFFYIKNVKTKKIWSNTKLKGMGEPDKYAVSFSSHMSKFKRLDSSIETTTKVVVAPNDPVEIRRLELKNLGNTEETLEISSFFEPVMSTSNQDYAHPAFNNLFITSHELEDGKILIERRKRAHDERNQYICSKLYTEGCVIGDLEYEIDKEKFVGKGNLGIPKMVEESGRFSKNTGLVTDSILAMKKTVKIEPGEKITLDLILSISDDRQEAENAVTQYENYNEIRNTIELARAKAEAENIYMGLKGTDAEKYQQVGRYLLLQNPMKSVEFSGSQEQLWKYGISGDKPMLLVKIKDANDMHMVSDSLKAYEFFRSKNIDIDLIILNEEKSQYEQYVKFEVESAILNSQMAYLRNKGIFAINANEADVEDLKLLEYRSNLVLDASNGKIETQIEDMEEEYIDGLPNVGEDAVGADSISARI